MTQMYEQAKQIKFLANSQLSPKLIFVMSVTPESRSGTQPKAESVLHRTILFGDSAPAFAAFPRLELVDSVPRTLVLEIPNNQENVSIQLPRKRGEDTTLFVVKSFPSGVALFGKLTLE